MSGKNDPGPHATLLSRLLETQAAIPSGSAGRMSRIFRAAAVSREPISIGGFWSTTWCSRRNQPAGYSHTLLNL